MYTSYVGSFPLDFSKGNVERVLSDAVEIGIDYPCYPQLRNFVHMFLDPLVDAGALRKAGGAYIANFPFYSLDLGEIAQELDLDEFTWSIELLKSSGLIDKVRGLRACVTGPFTLASQTYLRSPYTLHNSGLSSKIAVSKLTSYVAKLAEKFSTHAAIVSVDEPMLSVIVGDRGILFDFSELDIRSMLDKVFRSIKAMPSIHVCGTLSSRLVKLLLTTHVKLLDHEFKDWPKNLELFNEEELLKSGKLLALGAISTRRAQVEQVEEIKAFILSAHYKLRKALFSVKPDCGFGGLRGLFSSGEEAYLVALSKLKNLVEAAKEVNAELR